MASNLVSVCIPVFNGEKYIAECMESVLNQRDVNFELIISDNCSDDSTAHLYSRYRDARLKVIRNEKNIGSLANFNNCIRYASGDFFLLLPHDDVLLVGGLSRMLAPLKNNPSLGLCFGETIRIDSAGRALNSNYQMRQSSERSFQPADALSHIVENFNPLQHPLVRMEALSGVGGFRKSVGCYGDIDLWCRVIASGWGVYCVSERVSSLRVRPDQGQNLLKQNSHEAARALSAHFAFQLDRKSLIFYNQTLFFMRFIRSFEKVLRRSGLREVDMVSALVDRLIYDNIVGIIKSTLRMNLVQLRGEILISSRLCKWFSFRELLCRYLSGIEFLILERVRRMVPVSSKRNS